MALQIRRVITGHDANGRAVVEIDEVQTRCEEPLISLSGHSRSTANVMGFAKPHSRRGL